MASLDEETDMFETVMWILVAFGLVAQTLDAIFSAFSSSPEKELMNTRVSASGVRLGAAIDAMNAKARGQKPTNWR